MELDASHTQPPSPSEKPHPPAPLLPLAIGLILGIAADNLYPLTSWVSVAVVVFGALAALMGWNSQRVALLATRGKRGLAPSRRPLALPRVIFRDVPVPFCHVLGLLVAAAGVGSLRHAMADRWLAGNHVLMFTDEEPMLVELQGRVVGIPYLVAPAADVPRAYSIGPKTHFVIEASQLAGVDGPIAVSGRAAVSIKGAAAGLAAGDIVQMTGWLYRPRRPQNPGQYDWALHQRRNGLLVGLSCDHAESVIKLGRSGGALQRLLDGARARARGYLLDGAFDENDAGAGVLEAMVLAQRSAVPEAMNQAFIRTGNAHFLAASGMNVAWLAVTGWVAMTLLGLHYRKRAVVAALLIASYVLLAEPQPSILRAGIMGLLWCLSVYHRGRSNVLNWLACSAIILLLINPNDCFRPGFQYSFMAVLALVHLYPRVSAVAAAAMRKRPFRWNDRLLAAGEGGVPSCGDVETASGMAALARRAVHWLAQLLLLSLSAWFVTAPLCCYTFNQFTPWGAVNTCILWFVAAAVTCWGYLTLLAGILLPASGAVFGPVLKVGTNLMLGLVEVLAQVPGTILDGRSPSAWWVIAVYAAMGSWVYRPAILRWKHAFKIVAALLLVWWLVPPRWSRLDQDKLLVWVLAAGDGNAILVEMPNGKTAICDFGTRSPFDIGRAGVAFLKHRGIRTVDAVFVSHPDFDHYGGIEALSREIQVDRVLINDRFEPQAAEQSAARQFLEAMRKAGTPIEVVGEGTRFDWTGGAVVEVIWPPADAGVLQLDCNDSSMVLRISYQGRSILLPGDITDLPARRLMVRGGIRCDAMVLPHHGGVFGATRDLIAGVDPRIVVRSTGQRRGMTTSGVESLTAGRQYLSTADDGCVLLEIEEGELSARAVMAE